MSCREHRIAVALVLMACGRVEAQEPTPTREDQAVGRSINYVFATDLGSGVYELDGRSLQIYRYSWRREWRETTEEQTGVRFVLPVTAGFFDFSPVDVITEGPPTRVDSFSVMPGIELDFQLADDWHLIPYLRTGFSVASSSVDGWLYGAGLRAQREREQGIWQTRVRSELAYAGVRYRHRAEGDRFLRLRQAFDASRGLGVKIRGREWELAVYGIFDLIVDPPTAPLAEAREEPVQGELGITLATRPRIPLWRFEAPRLGLGYRLAGELSGWRLVIGAPF